MHDVTTVEWTAEERTVPYVGHFEKGKRYTLPTEQARQLIHDGNARQAQAKQQRTRSTTTEE